jgi:hypothetical protein
MQKGRDATVTGVQHRTKDLKASLPRPICSSPRWENLGITADMVAQGAVVIDVGINRVADPTKKRGYRIVGDVDYERSPPKCRAISPVPGGVGVMTIAMLMQILSKPADAMWGMSMKRRNEPVGSHATFGGNLWLSMNVAESNALEQTLQAAGLKRRLGRDGRLCDTQYLFRPQNR